MIELENPYGKKTWYAEITKEEMEEKIKWHEKDIENDIKNWFEMWGEEVIANEQKRLDWAKKMYEQGIYIDFC